MDYQRKNWNTLLALRAEHFDQADLLTKKAMATGKDLAGAELEQFNAHTEELKKINAELAKHGRIVPELTAGSSMAGFAAGMPSGANGPAIGRDVEGRAVPIFAKGQSVAEYTRQHLGADDNGVTLGDIARAMVVGSKDPEIRAALAEGSDSAGGYTVPALLSSMLIDLLRAKSTVFEAGAQTIALETGKTTTVATIASDPVATWRAENAAVATSDMTFGAVTFVPKSLAVIVTASRELVADSVNFNQAIMTSLTKSFAAELDRVALIGSGSSNQPKGISNIAGVGSVSMGVNGAALTAWDPFVTALGTLRTANAADPTAVILHPRSEQELNLLKDTQQRPLGRPKAIENLPFLVTSKLSIAETQGTANTASRAIMGNFAELLVGIRQHMTIQLLNEMYAGNYQYGFLASLRADIAVAHAASFAQVVGIL